MTGTKRFALRRPEKSRWSLGGAIPLGAAVLLALAGSAPAQRLPLPPEEQEAVNKAIDRGVVYLKRTQQKKGSWVLQADKHSVGYAALPGLTLLECGVSPKDPLIQKAAAFVRSRAGQLDKTYELSLGILFLDRLGEAKDEKLIQALALRLIAGQSATGGWGYKCPLLTTPLQMDLLAALRHLDPPQMDMPLLADKQAGQPGLAGGIAKNPADLDPIARALGIPPLTGTIAQTSSSSLGGNSSISPSGSTSTLDGSPPPASPPPPRRGRDCLGIAFLADCAVENDTKAQAEKTKANNGKAKRAKANKPYVLPDHLSILPVVQDPKRQLLQDPQDKSEALIATTTDNSNTQFAILALWTAQRHGIPMERTLNLVVRRFITSQNGDGSWGYHYLFGGGDAERPAMTCVGLIGLAVGHGLAQPKAAGQRIHDPRVVNGFIALNKNVGKPVEELVNQPMQNLYFLWSVERVAVLYNLPKIGDKDWYRWGAQVLITNQDDAGNWSGGQYHGNSPVLDTCLALLVLKRANLVKDLTAKLPFRAADLNASILRPASATPLRKTPEKKAEKKLLVKEPSPPEATENYLNKPPPSLDGLGQTNGSNLEGVSGDGGKKKWIVVSLLVFVVFAGGSLFFLLIARRRDEDEEKNREKAKGGRTKRRLQSTASPSGD
jgi:hypothetical protein